VILGVNFGQHTAVRQHFWKGLGEPQFERCDEPVGISLEMEKRLWVVCWEARWSSTLPYHDRPVALLQ